MNGSDGASPEGRGTKALAQRYFAFAHVALAAAAGLLVTQPQTYVGFFYHPRMMAVVHLITLGWLSSSILGGLYLVLPLALRTRVRIGRLDAAAFWSFMIGVAGMVSHFWLDTYSGMVWSALLAAAGLAYVASKAALAVVSARIALGVRLHLVFASVNILLTVTLGIVVGLARSHPLLPAATLDNVFAHLHLGAIGWVTMMLFGVGYRLLPMILASKMPSGWQMIASALFLEVGVLGIAGHYVLSLPSWTRLVSGLAAASGVGLFMVQVRWMLANRVAPRRPRPGRDVARWPISMWHGLQAFLFLGLTTALGLLLTSGRIDPELALRLAPVYGVCGLLGFLGRAVAGVGLYLLPVAAWVRATREHGPSSARPSPDALGRRRWQAIAFTAWTLAVPALAVGQFAESPDATRAAGLILAVAAIAGGIDHWRAFSRAFES